MELQRLIYNTSVTIQEIASYLDGLTPKTRWSELLTLGRGDQRMLYVKAADAEPLTLEHFVGSHIPGRVAVHHLGRNTLPLPPKHRLFQKRFCRPEQGEGILYGYNESPSLPLIGPGYFVAISTEKHRVWQERGPVVVDYFQVPDQPVVASWPKVVPNNVGLQKFVYHHTRDFMRGVSKHVSIGAAFKEEKALDHYFVLCREDR
jgi:hypothetical protein